MNDARWIVIWKRDADPAEIYRFENRHGPDGADAFYERAQTNWTEVFLCEVLRGPCRSGSEAAPNPSEK